MGSDGLAIKHHLELSKYLINRAGLTLYINLIPIYRYWPYAKAKNLDIVKYWLKYWLLGEYQLSVWVANI